MERISIFSVSHLADRKASLFQSESGGSGTRSIDPSSPRDAPRLEMAPSKAMLIGRSFWRNPCVEDVRNLEGDKMLSSVRRNS